MNKIKVDVKKNSIIFSIYNREIKEENMNDTNIIDTKNLKFSEQYILDNLELVSSFFNIIILKEKINTAIIKNLDISETVLKIINYIQNINICISRNVTVNNFWNKWCNCYSKNSYQYSNCNKYFFVYA